MSVDIQNIVPAAVQAIVDLLGLVGFSTCKMSHDSIAVGEDTIIVHYEGDCLRAIITRDGEEVGFAMYHPETNDDVYGFSYIVAERILGILAGSEPTEFTPYAPEPLFERLKGRTVTDVTELPCRIYMNDPYVPQVSSIILHMDDESKILIQDRDPGCGCCGAWVNDISEDINGTALDNLAIVEVSKGEQSSEHDILADGKYIMKLCCDWTETFLLLVVPPQED